jgi:hypothetical protein
MTKWWKKFMFRFIETIKLADGNYKLIDYHDKRMNATIAHFFNMIAGNRLRIFCRKLKHIGRGFTNAG